ncbi:RNA polymerase sigma-70 factor, ECF subfamily [Sinosporangium album]|uniref:RNA polymerase sigma-70 factor, ECF subfamily n=1 Tax=Sinosporangium album TaxID=504805 RepID=A0A1G7UZT8_9ACTN|nr:sigma-70 family RNA polymerase sigma factor [Sinosporangium album]SDG53135.1 RNA polymerase sigma-70 factor, ECF subfamily [Sinosporangium album]
MDSLETLETLEARLASGDDDALGECLRAHAPLLRAYLRRLVPARDIDDVVQIVFSEVWRSRHRFDPARSLPAWMIGIAHKRAVDHLRARTLQTVPLDAVADPPARDGTAEGHGLPERDEVRRALAALPAPQREAIELAYYGDLTQREIAERLHIPLGTVKARTARGLRRLATLLSPVAA